MKFTEILAILKSVLFKPDIGVPLPKHLQIDITTCCNLKCAMCYSKSIVPVAEHNTNMSLEQFVSILDSVRPLSVNMAANGEPFLNPKFFEMVDEAASRGIKTITSSNGIMSEQMAIKVAGSRLDILKISIDGATKEAYEAMRGPHYDALMRTIFLLQNQIKQDKKRAPQLRFDMVITKKNYTEIAEYIAFCASKGVFHAFFHPLDVRSFDSEANDSLVRGLPIEALIEQLKKARTAAKKLGVTTNLPALLGNMHILRRLHLGEPLSAVKRLVCLLPWLGMFVSVTGEVSPCCAMYPRGAISAGNINAQNAGEVWNGEKMKSMRQLFKLKKNYEVYDGCAYCMPMNASSLMTSAKTFPGYIKEIFTSRKKLLKRHLPSSILMINPMDSTYGSTHRIRKLREGIPEKTAKVTYVEPNSTYKGAVSFTQKNNALGFLLGTLRRVKLALFENYRILFIQTITPLTVPVMMAAKIRGKKVLADWDDVSWVLQKNGFRAWLVKICEHVFIKLPDVVFVPNKYVAGYAEKYNARSVVFAPHGVDIERFNPQSYDPAKVKNELGIGEAPVLGFLASFTTGGVGDLETIFQAVISVMRRRSDVHFLVIGGGPLYENYVLRAGELQIRNIHFTGFLEQKDIPRYISAIDIALIFMRESMQNTMKTSLKVGEYAAMNKPMVGRLAGQTRDDFSSLCRDGGDNAESFADAILTELSQPKGKVASREKMANEYSWDRCAGIVTGVIERMETA